MGIHKDTGTNYNLLGYDKNGWNKDSINKETGTLYDKDGWNTEGYDAKGIFRYEVYRNPEIDRRHDDHGH